MWQVEDQRGNKQHSSRRAGNKKAEQQMWNIEQEAKGRAANRTGEGDWHGTHKGYRVNL